MNLRPAGKDAFRHEHGGNKKPLSEEKAEVTP